MLCRLVSVMQKRIFSGKQSHDYLEQHALYQGPSLLERRAATRLTLMFKIVHGYVDINTTLLQTGDRITRQSSPLTYKHIHANKNCYRSSFFPRTIPEWNMLPLSLRSASTINNFKSGLSQINMNHIITSSHYYQ